MRASDTPLPSALVEETLGKGRGGAGRRRGAGGGVGAAGGSDERAEGERLAAGRGGGGDTAVEELAELAGLVTGLEDVVGRVGGDQGGGVCGEDGLLDVAGDVVGVGGVLGGEAGHEEGDLWGLGVGGETDVGAADVLLELLGVLDPGLAVLGVGEGEVAARGGEAGHLGAELLDGAHAETVLALDALEVGVVVGGGAVVGAVEEGRVQRLRRVVALQEVLEGPAELHDLGVAGAGRAALRRGGADKESAAQSGEEAHGWGGGFR